MEKLCTVFFVINFVFAFVNRYIYPIGAGQPDDTRYIIPTIGWLALIVFYRTEG
jgi:hypothetical protein